MASPNDIILVTGGTGTQGNATIRALLALFTDAVPIEIHALVRNPDAPRAQSLARLSPAIKLYTGDLNSTSSVAAAAANCTACFLNVMPDFKDPSVERRYVANTLNALGTVSAMKRIVYTTASGVRDPAVPGNFVNVLPGSLRYGYLESKWANEQAVQKAAENQHWAWTILQPGFFLTNFLPPMAKLQYPFLTEHKIITLLPPDFQFSFLDPYDIGRFAAHSLVSPEGRNLPDLSSKKIGLASTHLTLGEVMNIMTKVLAKHGKDVQIKIEYINLEEAKKQKDTNIKIGSEFYLLENNISVDVDQVRSYGIELGSVEDFFESEIDRVYESLGL